MTTSELLSRLTAGIAEVEVERSRATLCGEHRGGAWFDPSRRYRYLLWRAWGDGGRVLLFVCLNPSTADQDTNDPTVQRCETRARAWGFDVLLVANLFAWRATDPRELTKAIWPVGTANDETIVEAHRLAEKTICAWGAGKPQRSRAAAVRQLLHQAQRLVYHLSLTADGSPRHPLYLPYSAEPQVWEAGS